MEENYKTYRIKKSYLARRGTFEGKSYLIVPVVMIVEGVHHGSAGPILHVAEEMEKSVPAWNGIPVMLNHPEVDGRFVSANSPEILERWKIGRVFNTQFKDNKLTCEAWLEEDKLKSLDESLYQSILDGKMVEVSVGVFSDESSTAGEWNGESYVAVSRNYRPDHLAILPQAEGACSVADGCGVRQYMKANKKGGTNMKEIPMLVVNTLKYTGTESTDWHAPTLSDFGVDGQWADLAREEKARIASHFLLGTSSAETFEELKLPVVNPKTGKLNERALRAVISGRGASVKGVDKEELAAARRRAYRLLNEEFDAGLEIPENLVGFFAFLSYKSVVDKATSYVNSLDDPNKMNYLRDVGEISIVYEEVMNGSNKFYKQNYRLENEELKPVGDRIPVALKWEEIKVSGKFKRMEDRKMSKTNELLKAYIQLKEEDEQWIASLPEEAIQRLQERVVQPQNCIEKAKEQIKGYVQGTEQLLELVPESMKEAVQAGLQMYQEQRKEMIKEISEAAPDIYSAEELEKKPMEELRKLHKLVSKGADYRGVRMMVQSHEGPEPLLPPGVEVERK